MAMNKEAKHDALATKTVEVCVRVLVKNGEAHAFEDALVQQAKTLKGFIANSGGYVEPAESQELEEMLDNIPDEVVEAL